MRERLVAGAAALALFSGAVLAATTTGAEGADGPRAGTSAVPKPKHRRLGGDPAGDVGAVIRRTRYGVPHITAKDYESAAYGQAYAFAEDNLCTLAETVVTVAGERSRYFGPEKSWVFSGNSGEFNNLDSDFFYGRINKDRTVEKLMAKRPPQGPLPEIEQATRGFVRGYNAYLRDVGGAKGVPDPRCNGKDWVRPLKEIDIYRRYFQLGSLASSGVAIDGISQAAPVAGGSPLTVSQRKSLVPELGRRLRDLGGLGSNAYGIGGDATDNGRGMVLGNPHFPWAGAERLYQNHLTIPGKADVSGATLYGVPAVLIGHTRGLAWSHTVATAWRFTPFELKLVPGDPRSYLLDGQVRRMKETRVTVKALVNGKLEDRSRTLYETVHGPMLTSLLGLPLFPWTPTTAFALGDVNANNFRYLNHFVKTNQAQSVREYHAIQERYQGIPWVNSLAADRNGEAYYSMNGAIPNMPNAKVSACQSALGAATSPTLGLPIPDGSRSACMWGGKEPGAADDGLLPNSRIPFLFRRDYVANGNDSHWLANPSRPLEGFDRIVGIERAEVTPRTRLGNVMMRDRLAGRDGLPGRRVNLEILEKMALGNRQYLGELWRDRLVGICRANPSINGVDVSGACDVLARWNLRDDLDSPGALLFRRFAARAYPATQSLPTGTQGSAELGDRAFSEAFDPNRPVDTPAGLQDSSKVRSALASAVTDLNGAGLPLNTTLRRVQKDREGTPIHGGPGGLGVFQAISTSWNGKGLTPIYHGSSFIMAARFQDGPCPARSSTFVTYGESENRTSPHRTDYARAFSAKRWNRPPFCPSEVLADKTLATTTYVGNACTPRGGLRAARVSRARGGGVRIGLRRARRARVRVDLLRVTRRGLRRVRTFRRTKSFRVRGLPAGVYVARFRIKTANGRTDERRKGFVLRAGRVRRSGTFFRTGCGFVERLSLASPVVRGRPRLTFRLDRTARVSLRILRGKRTVRRVKLRTRRGERTYSVRLPRLRRGAYRVRLGAVSPGKKRVRSTLRFIRR